MPDWVIQCLECGAEEMHDGRCGYCQSEFVEIREAGTELPPFIRYKGELIYKVTMPQCRNCFRPKPDHLEKPDGRWKCLSTLGPGAGHGYWDPL